MALPLDYQYVVVEGNIGSGKTTLSKMLADTYDTRLMLEEFKDNPFLPKFYDSPKRYGFPLELSFLAERYHQKRNELNRTDLFKPSIISDYSFAKSLVFAKINLDDDKFQLYQSLFKIIHGRLPKPDLLVYLHCSAEKSKKQITKRGREYEQEISLHYLQSINDGYMTFFKQQKGRIVIIDTENLDFVKNQSDYRTIKNIIETQHRVGLTIIDSF